MEFYKKNPKIEGNPTIQGRLIDDDTVVCGDEFKIFTDPSTFPGKPPKLVKVEFKDLTKAQREQVQDLITEKKGMPPRHLGVIKSDVFESVDGGDIKVIDASKLRTDPKPKVLPVKPAPKVLPVKPAPMRDLGKPRVKLISEMYTHATFAEEFPGVTERNARKALKKTTTLEALSVASNSELRRMGIIPSFYGRLREKALELMEQEE